MLVELVGGVGTPPAVNMPDRTVWHFGASRHLAPKSVPPQVVSATLLATWTRTASHGRPVLLLLHVQSRVARLAGVRGVLA